MFKIVLRIILILFICVIDLRAQTNKGKVPVKQDVESQVYSITCLEDFEFSNPYDHYAIELFGKSDLRLYTTRDAYEGEYALKMVYSLLSDNLWGCRVMTERKFDPPVDIGEFKKASIMIKGDGSLNTFKIQLVDVDGEVYSYESVNAFQNSSWHELVFTRFDFVLDKGTVKKDGGLGSKIKAVRFLISSPLVEQGSGTVFLDRFNVYTSYEQFQNRDKEKNTSSSISQNLFRGSSVDVEYRDISRTRAPGTLFYDPMFSQGDLFVMWYELNSEYRYKYFLIQGDIGFLGRDFSMANSKWGRYKIYGQNLKLTMDTSKFLPFTQSLSFGQVNPAFNQWVFYNDKEYWWEGAELNGKMFKDLGYDKTGYNLFYVKGWNDSYAAGLKEWITIWDIQLTASGVLSRDNALLTNNRYDMQSKNVLTDNVGMIELVRGFPGLTSQGGFAVVWMNYGHHYYKRYGKIYKRIREAFPDDSRENVYQDRDITEITNEDDIIGDNVDLGSLTYKVDSEGNPIFEPLASPVKHESDLYEARVRLKDIPFRYMEENISVKKIGPYFKPKYFKRMKVDGDVMSLDYSMILDLNPWHSYKNWQFGLEGSLGESTKPRTDPYYFNNLRNVVWNIGKFLGPVSINFKQSYVWWQFPNDLDQRSNSFDLYNWITMSIKFAPDIISDMTLTDHSRRKYESGQSDINYYVYQFRLNFKLYILRDALIEVDYIKTVPPDSVDFIRNEWELDNLVKAVLHMDIKF